MEAYLPSSIGLCPINFNSFNELNKKLNNLEACVLLAKLKFHQANSKIIKEGKVWIARSRNEIAEWFSFSLKKVDRLLSLLETNGMIEKKVSTWYGTKKLFITISDSISQIPINFKIFKILSEQTCSVKAALVYSRIAYAFANSKIQHNGLKWCCIKKEDLSKWSGISIRALDSILESYLRSGILLKKNFIWKEKKQTHFHIPQFTIEVLTNRVKNNIESQSKTTKVNGQIYRQQPAKKEVSIIKRTKSKQANNNTYNSDLSTIMRNQESDIIFNTIAEELTKRQEAYLEAAITQTVQRKKLKISSPTELWEQLKFSILTPVQRKGVETFQHAVSRYMKILADGNWRTPIGFNSFSCYGTELKKTKDLKLRTWENQKNLEKQASKEIFRNTLLLRTHQIKQTKDEKLTQEAIGVGKKLKFLTKGKEAIVEYGSTLYWMVDELTRQIEGFIRQGANKDKVVAFLQEACTFS